VTLHYIDIKSCCKCKTATYIVFEITFTQVAYISLPWQIYSV